MPSATRHSPPTNLSDLLQPGQSALLVYDMQAGIVPAVQHSALVRSAVVQLVKAARAASVPVFLSKHYAVPLRWCGPSQLRLAMRFQPGRSVDQLQPHLQKGSPECELIPELAPAPDDFVFDKLGMSFFVGTPLEYCLRDMGVGTVVVAGCVTEIGIEPTVLHAADLGFYPVTVSDACGSLNEDNQRRAMQRLGSIGKVASAEQVASVWAGKA